MTTSGSENLDVARWSVRAWPGWARGVAALLITTSRAVPAVVTIAWAAGVNFEPQLAFAALIALGLVPALAALLLDRAFRAEVEIGAGEMRIARDGFRIEVPLASLAVLSAWRVPLPGAGASLRLRSGKRFPVSIEPAPPSLVAALALAGVAAPAQPNLVYGAARREVARRLWQHPLVKFGLFGLAPTAVLFRAHQVIAFGGPLGQYYLEGLRPYLATALEYGAITLLYLVVIACTLRVFGEAIALVATWLAPQRARPIRVLVEGCCAVAFYAGVPALLALRFLG